ncbi:Fic family protein [Leuconostocaceae bacterium ESL0958]|nr:Fic family protein [Leuconostocaceae bacterium ESL0958]
MDYQSLLKAKYNGNGPSLSRLAIQAEYQNRLNSWSTQQTQLYPLLDNYKDSYDQTNQYPLFYVFTQRMIALANAVQENSKSIRRIAGRLPGIAEESYVKKTLVEEIYHSNEIEGVKTNREELNTIAGEVLTRNGRPVKKKRLISTMNLYHDAMQGRAPKIQHLKDFRKIYDQVLEHEIPEKNLPDGRLFRNSKVYIGSSTQVRHLPPSTEEAISEQLLPLIAFMNGHETLPVIKALVSHFLFENTHPFIDGNGRMGRYLLSAYLSDKYDKFTGLSISSAIDQSRSQYYQLFKEASDVMNYADMTMFIEGLLAIILDGQEKVLQELSERLQRLDSGRELLEEELKAFYQKHRLKEIDQKAVFNFLYVLLQSELFEGEPKEGVELNKIVSGLKEYLGVPESHSKQLRKLLEAEGFIQMKKARPIRYGLGQSLRL